MTMFAALPFLIIVLELIWQKYISYPATLEQIQIGVQSFQMLWLTRLISLALLLASFYLVTKLISKELKKYFWILTVISPLLSLVWMSHPVDSLKVFVVIFLFHIFKKYSKSIFVATLGVGVAIVILNIYIFKEKPGILEALSFKKAQQELTFRFNVEDNTSPKITLPLLVRRIGYNKYSIAFKNLGRETMNFFDTETLFFQEVHPLGQKAFVVFFWPQIFILGLSIFYISRNGKKKSNNIQVILSFLFLSLIYFLTSSASADRRQLLTILALGILMAEGAAIIYTSKSKLVSGFLTLLIALTIYGWATNIYDRSVRPDFWLDNRPIAYDFVLNGIKDNNLNNYSTILVPDTLYATKDYCKLYLSDCSKFKSENFDLYGTLPEKDVLYIGFTGNFMGLNFTNSSNETIEATLKGKGLKVYATRHILNNIASGYGQELIVAGIPK